MGFVEFSTSSCGFLHVPLWDTQGFVCMIRAELHRSYELSTVTHKVLEGLE